MNKLFYIVYEVIGEDNITRYCSEFVTLEDGLTSDAYNGLLENFTKDKNFVSSCVFNIIPVDIFLAPLNGNTSNMVVHFKGVTEESNIVSGSLAIGINISKLNTEKHFNLVIDFIKSKVNLTEAYIHSITTLSNKPI